MSATGHDIPPFVIFNSKSLDIEWRNGEVPSTSYSLSNKGWRDAELLRGWFTDHFLENAVAREHIILFCIPPHTTLESQPLNTSVFKPLEQRWQDVCHDYVQTLPGSAVTKYQSSELSHKV